MDSFSKLPQVSKYQIWIWLHPIELLRVVTVSIDWWQQLAPHKQWDNSDVLEEQRDDDQEQDGDAYIDSQQQQEQQDATDTIRESGTEILIDHQNKVDLPDCDSDQQEQESNNEYNIEIEAIQSSSSSSSLEIDVEDYSCPIEASAPGLSQVRHFSLRSCDELYSFRYPYGPSGALYEKAAPFPFRIVQGLACLLACLSGVEILDVTQYDIVTDDVWLKPHDDNDYHDDSRPSGRARQQTIPLERLLHPICHMNRLTTLIWNDEILDYTIVEDPYPDTDQHIRRCQLPHEYNQFPATLTHLELRIKPAWWKQGQYQTAVATWPPLRRLLLQFGVGWDHYNRQCSSECDHSVIKPDHRAGDVGGEATFFALVDRHAETLEHLDYRSGHFTWPEWSSLAKCQQLRHLDCTNSTLHGLTHVQPPTGGLEQTPFAMSSLSRLSVLVLPGACWNNSLPSLSQSTLDSLLLSLLSSLPRQLQTLDMHQMSEQQINYEQPQGAPKAEIIDALITQITNTSTAFIPCFASIVVLELSVSPLLHSTIPAFIQMLGILAPTLQQLKLNWNHGESVKAFTTQQVVLLSHACPGLRTISWRPTDDHNLDVENQDHKHNGEMEHQHQHQHQHQQHQCHQHSTPTSAASSDPHVHVPSYVDLQLLDLVSQLPESSLCLMSSLTVNTSINSRGDGYSYSGFGAYKPIPITVMGLEYLSRFRALTQLHLNIQIDEPTSRDMDAEFEISVATKTNTPTDTGSGFSNSGSGVVIDDGKLRMMVSVLPLLQQLSITATLVTDAGMEELPRLMYLEHLTLKCLSCRISDNWWLSAALCTRLQRLSISYRLDSYCRLTVFGLTRFVAQAAPLFLSDWETRARNSPSVLVNYPKLAITMPRPCDFVGIQAHQHHEMERTRKQLTTFPIHMLQWKKWRSSPI